MTHSGYAEGFDTRLSIRRRSHPSCIAPSCTSQADAVRFAA